MLLYKMIAGAFPFDGKTRSEIVQEIRKKTPTLLEQGSETGAQSPRAERPVINLIRRLLEKDRNLRIEVAELLRHPWLSSKTDIPPGLEFESPEKLDTVVSMRSDSFLSRQEES